MNLLFLKNFIIFPLIFLVILLVRVNTTNVGNTNTTTTSLHDHDHHDTGDHHLEAFQQANGRKTREFQRCCTAAGYPLISTALVCKVSSINY